MEQPQSSPTATKTATSANGGAQSTSSSVIGQAQQWLRQGNLSQLLGQVPASLKKAGTSTATSLNKLSTTQKVVGGALLVAGATYLTRRGGQGKGAQAATLNELLYFVNDRIEGYRRAAEETKESQHRIYYLQLVSQSQRFANQLNVYLSQEGGKRQTSTTLKGKLYRAFMDAKAAVTGRDESSIIGSNIYGEEWAIKAYEEALNDQTLHGPLRRAVEDQFAQSKRTYAELKKMAANQ